MPHVKIIFEAPESSRKAPLGLSLKSHLGRLNPGLPAVNPSKAKGIDFAGNAAGNPDRAALFCASCPVWSHSSPAGQTKGALAFHGVWPPTFGEEEASEVGSST